MTEAETLKLKAQARRRRAEAQGGQPVEARPWSELPGNIGPSALEAGRNYLHVLNPMNYPETVGGMLHLGAGAISKIPGVQAVNDWAENAGLAAPRDREAEQQDMELAGNVWQGLKDRYLGLDNIKNTMITDPSGFALDFATVFAGGAGLAGRGPMIANKAINSVQKIQQMPRGAEKLLRRAAPKNTQVIDNLGDEAMLLDAGPGMTGLAQGVVTKPSPHSDAIIDALTARQEGRSDRLLHGTQNTLGRLRDPVALKKTLDKAGQRAAEPHYKLAKENPPDIRTPELENLLAQQMTEPMKGMSLSKRTKTLEYFDKIEDAWFADNPADVVRRLHSLRQELDTKIYDKMSVSGEDRVVAQEVRGIVDDILKDRVPGFMEGDKIISTSNKAQEDIDFGYDALEGGKSAMFPETFFKEYAKRNPKYVGEGVKGRLANAMGTNANDTAALRRIIGDGNDFNRRKLIKTFGQSKTDEIVSAVEREQTFGQNFADITRNSQTARRQASQKLVEGADAPRISQGASVIGLTAAGVTKGLNKLLAKGVTKYSEKNADALAKALALRGVDARKLAAELSKSNSQGDKLRKIVKALVMVNAADMVNRPHR